MECNCEHSDGIPCCGNSECPVYEVDGRMYVSFCETGCCRKNHGVGKTIDGVNNLYKGDRVKGVVVKTWRFT